MPSSDPIEIFYSYSHKDEALRDQIEKHLSILCRRGLIQAWHDRRISAGDDWEKEISGNLERAQIVLLLISSDFLASEYCYGVELQRAMQRHEAGEALVIPIILRPVDWRDAPFSKLQALPKDARPVTTWSNRDKAFLEIANGIREAVELLHSPAETIRELHRPRSVFSLRPNQPEILPYLCDRSDQERELCLALRRHQELKPRRPFVCIAHGEQRECHSEFVKRMQQTSLASVLNLRARQVSIEEYRLQWPSTPNRGSNLEPLFWSILGESLLDNSTASKAEIFAFIAANEKPLLITSRLLSEDFSAKETGSLEAFLRFWEQMPDLPPGRTLMSFICLKYQQAAARSRLQRWKFKRSDGRLRSLVTRLDFSTYQGLYGVTLPELKAIRHADVLAWIHSKSVQAFCNIKEKEVSSLFARPELCTADGHISMELLVDELNALIYRCRH